MPDGEHDDVGDVFGASGVGRLGEEEERNEAELMGSSRGRGGGGGHGYGERRRRTRSVVLRERAEEGEGVQGESEGVERECVALGAGSRSGGSRRWHGRVPACGEHTPRVLLARGGRRLADGPGGLYSARPARYSLSLSFCYCFSIFL